MAARGRPPKVVNAKQVAALARMHCTYEEMASVLGCSIDTLERRFKDAIEAARDQGKMSLRRAQWAKALGKNGRNGDRVMQIWLGKNHLGQRDTVEHEHGGRDGKPIAHTVEVVFVEPTRAAA